MFDDLISANVHYQARFHDPGISGVAGRQLAVLTCIDSRIDPLAMLGLRAGDAKIMRNAGARVTPDSLRSLVLAATFLDVKRICVVQHTDCAMTSRSNAEIAATIEESTGVRPDWDFLTMADQRATLAADVAAVRECELLPDDVVVGGFIFNVASGALEPVD